MMKRSNIEKVVNNRRSVILLELVVLLAAAACLAALAAPAPKPRPIPPPPVLKMADLEGKWLLDWGGELAEVHLERNGGYCCFFRGELWLGRWRIVAGQVEVSEWLPGNQMNPFCWVISGPHSRERIHGNASHEWGQTAIDLKKARGNKPGA
jgi:hypothetical protein